MSAVRGSDLIIEAATEDLDLKLKIFAQLADLAGHRAILATNTSSISNYGSCETERMTFGECRLKQE